MKFKISYIFKPERQRAFLRWLLKKWLRRLEEIEERKKDWIESGGDPKIPPPPKGFRPPLPPLPEKETVTISYGSSKHDQPEEAPPRLLRLHEIEQIVWRMRQCSKCVQAGKCTECGCDTLGAMQDPYIECSARKWLKMKNKEDWNKFKKDTNFTI